MILPERRRRGNFVFRSSSEPSTILMISLATGVICARAPTVVVRATVGTCQGRTVLKRHAVLRRQCCVDASPHRRLSGAFQVSGVRAVDDDQTGTRNVHACRG